MTKPPSFKPPYPQRAFPKPYNPDAISRQAQAAANRAVQAQISALPTVEQQSAPYLQQIASEKGLGDALLNEMRGAQTYRVNLATGLPQAFSADAASTGGDASTASRAAATLASFGTSAANQIAQQEAVAPASTAANTRIIQQRLTDLLTGPQGHDALARQIQAQEPNLENSYTSAYAQQAQIPFNEALQLATANENAALAQQTYGLNATTAANTAAYQRGELDLRSQSLALQRLGQQITAQRDANSYQVALKRLAQQARTSQNATDARAAAQAQSALTRARTSIIQQANTLYKRTSSTGGTPGTWTVTYFTGGGVNPTTPHTETFHTAEAAQARLAQLKPLTQPASGSSTPQITNLNSQQTQAPVAGQGGQNAAYLQNQAVNYGVNMLLQSAPWLPRSAAIRMVQQLVNPIFTGGNRSGQPRRRTNSAPGRG